MERTKDKKLSVKNILEKKFKNYLQVIFNIVNVQQAIIVFAIPFQILQKKK